MSFINNLYTSVRPLNLFIVGLTQCYFFFILIQPVLFDHGIEPQLNTLNFLLFCGVTILISASGYLINDFFDFDIDHHNQVAKSGFSKKALLNLYIILIVTGGFIAFYISNQLGKWHLFLIYPVVVILLYWYSAQLKYRGLSGNMIVAGFTAFVTLILFVAEPYLLQPQSEEAKRLGEILIAFSTFSFLSNLIREIIKDVEDQEGDLLKNSRSLPINWGTDKTKVLLNIIIILLILLLAVWTFTFEVNDFRALIFNCIFLIAPLILSLLRLHKAKTKMEYHHLSTFYKWVMVCGLISLILISTNV